MRDYNQYCPVALASEVLADRWTPLIARELVLGSCRFNDIARALPGISRTLLLRRLRHLEQCGVLDRVPVKGGHQYELTDAGRDLEAVIMAFGEWAVRWMFAEPEPREVEPVTLTWWMSRRLDLDRIPSERRVVVEFDYTGPDPTRIWLVLDRGEPSVCTSHPGFDTDVVVSAEPVALMRVFSGIVSLRTARATGQVVLSGPPWLLRQLPGWFLWSPFAPAVRSRLQLGLA
ncbi:transcriptional regulator [Mumia zhuanghuii]|uniref:Winged helix-turn-helix transcriptional regulator n=2 Tax=Mumia TaxID=1546255 RepID=A0ABW1QGI2_9ACTN|nr:MULTISPECIES: winged helix-turn-helix transcriptional regulator [Mumia]KAA1424704.1 transcriptional regulator [Mumia zhuanghuii]